MSLRELRPKTLPAMSVPHTGSAAPLSNDTELSGDIGCRVYVSGGAAYWGGAAVTASTGQPIDDGGRELIPVRKPANLYFIAGAPGVTVRTVLL